MKEAKEAFKGAKKDLQNMVDTGRATKINKKVFRKGVKYDSDALFPTKKKNFNKGGRVGLKFGSRKSNVQKIQETFGPKKKLSIKQMKIAKQAGDPNKIEGVDFKKLQQKRKV